MRNRQVQYDDDTVLTGLITDDDDDDDDDEHYRQEIDSFVQWCERNYLELHVWGKHGR